MMGFVIFLHMVVCLFAITVILMQSGRGGGLTEGFVAAESMFGAKTNEFMVRMTAIFGGLFLVTSLTLGYFSAHQERSLIPDNVGTRQPIKASVVPEPAPAPADTASAPAEPAPAVQADIPAAVVPDAGKP